jgi:hypothetical protein
MPETLTYWTADEVAECLPISRELSGKLWEILDDAQNPTPLGGDGSDGTVELPCGRLDLDNDDKAGHWWGRLSAAEQAEVAEALKKEGLA